MLAAIREDSVNLPLLLHVLGATILVGGLVTALTALFLAWRRTTASEVCAFGRVGFRTLLFVAVPGWLLMRLAGEWTASEAGWNDLDETPDWLDIGYITGEAGGLLLLISIFLSGIGLRRLGRSGGSSSKLVRVATVLVGIVLVAYIVTAWAMSAKPD